MILQSGVIRTGGRGTTSFSLLSGEEKTRRFLPSRFSLGSCGCRAFRSKPSKKWTKHSAWPGSSIIRLVSQKLSSFLRTSINAEEKEKRFESEPKP